LTTCKTYLPVYMKPNVIVMVMVMVIVVVMMMVIVMVRPA
jgi:hypothetical protein